MCFCGLLYTISTVIQLFSITYNESNKSLYGHDLLQCEKKDDNKEGVQEEELKINISRFPLLEGNN